MTDLRCYFDITDLLHFARSNATISGIQRVCLRLIGHLVHEHGPDTIRLIAYNKNANGLIEISSSFFNGSYTFDQEKFFADCGLPPNLTLKGYVAGKHSNPTLRRLHRKRLALTNYLTAGRTFRKLNIENNGLPKNISRPTFKHGDKIVLLGATWHFPELIDELRDVKKATGAQIAFFVHDLIPVNTPEHVDERARPRFYNWIRSVSSITDSYITNSKCTRKDLDAFLRRESLPLAPFHIVPLAHEFTTPAPANTVQASTSPVRPHVVDIARSPYVLCVGTWEPRKNLLALANVWKNLLDELGRETMPKLVLAGKPSFGIEKLNEFLNHTNNLDGHIVICERPSDEEIEYLYRNCLFSVFPSLYEGWGLPIGESLWFGKVVVASNQSSTPEVGGDMADYIDPHSLDSMREGIKRPIADPAYLADRTRQIQRDKLRTWRMVASDLWRAISSQPALPLTGDEMAGDGAGKPPLTDAAHG